MVVEESQRWLRFSSGAESSRKRTTLRYLSAAASSMSSARHTTFMGTIGLASNMRYRRSRSAQPGPIPSHAQFE
eukprot:1177287-Prorocentrum_minimum.AAC.1